MALTEEHELVKFAQERAREIEADAHLQADEILSETDDYIVDQLSELEEQLMKTLTTVRNGLRLVRDSHPRRGEVSEPDQEFETETED